MKDDPHRFFVPAVHIINKLAPCHYGHEAAELVAPDRDRAAVDRALRWLKRRKLVRYDAGWRLTELGQIAFRANRKRAREEARRG